MKTVVPIEHRILAISHDTWSRLLRQFGLVGKILDDSQEMEWPKSKQRQYRKKLKGCLTFDNVPYAHWHDTDQKYLLVGKKFEITTV